MENMNQERQFADEVHQIDQALEVGSSMFQQASGIDEMVTVSEGEEEFILTLSTPLRNTKWIGLTVSWAERSFDVYVAESHFILLVERAGFSTKNVDLSSSVASIILTHLCRSFQTMIQPIAQSEVIANPNLKSPSFNDENPAVCFAVDHNGSGNVKGNLLVQASKGDLDFLAQSWRDHSKPNIPSHEAQSKLSELAIWSPKFHISKSEYERLSLGDVILFDPQYNIKENLSVCLDRKLWSEVDLVENDDCELLVDFHNDIGSGAQEPIPDNGETVPFRVELGIERIPAIEAYNLEAGSQLPFSYEKFKWVRIFSGETEFAKGNITKFEDLPCVQIMTMAG